MLSMDNHELRDYTELQSQLASLPICVHQNMELARGYVLRGNVDSGIDVLRRTLRHIKNLLGSNLNGFSQEILKLLSNFLEEKKRHDEGNQAAHGDIETQLGQVRQQLQAILDGATA